MALKYLGPIFILTLFCVFVHSFPNDVQNNFHLIYEQDAPRHSSLSRFKRQSPILGYKNYMQAASQPSVVVMPSGVPNNAYRVPGYSYGIPNSYGDQGSSYGASRAPTVVVNMPDDNYITPIANNPYVLQSRRL